MIEYSTMKIPAILSRLRRPEVRPKIERTYYGFKFYLPESLDDDELLRILAGISAGAYKLPDNEGLVLDFQNRLCSGKLILKLLAGFVWRNNVKILAWLSSNPDTRRLFALTGFNSSEPPREINNMQRSAQNANVDSDNDINDEINNEYPGWKILYNSVRSGQRIETDGDVLLWGHLNAGGEISAGGSIIVAGKLHGIVHAGAYGREDVFIWSGIFATPQVRIANKLCYADKNSTTGWLKSVLITLESGTPVIREDKFINSRMEDK